MTTTLKKLASWLLVPLLLAVIGTLVTVYFVSNPTDGIVARQLQYPKVLAYLVRHVFLVILSSLLAILTAVPAGILLTRKGFRFLAPVIINIVNIGQTIPSIAILALFMSILGLGVRTAVFALWLYSLLPILRNTYTGIQGVNPGIIEAARGMGMPPQRVLWRIEFPLALRVIMAGIRTAVVINVGTATLSTFIGAGGLGDLIITGLSLSRITITLTGGILAALLAILADYFIGQVEIHLLAE
ncbi:MAG: ABC transporter permease [bacterium]|jgi:osmoprotectant transport system permease protein|nr:ABC transporter permease [Bacillota bacterium]HHW55296.1 ABC transporter permease [Bacillota bacterium]